MKSTKKLAERLTKVDDLGFRDISHCITWVTYEKEVKLNPIAEPILFILGQLSELIGKVHQAACDIEMLQENVTSVSESITSISNKLAGYDP